MAEWEANVNTDDLIEAIGVLTLEKLNFKAAARGAGKKISELQASLDSMLKTKERVSSEKEESALAEVAQKQKEIVSLTGIINDHKVVAKKNSEIIAELQSTIAKLQDSIASLERDKQLSSAKQGNRSHKKKK